MELCGVWSMKTGEWEEQTSLRISLGLEGNAMVSIISLVGGGGKTTTMYQLAKELAAQGKRVLVTTSVHIQHPSSPLFPVVEQWTMVLDHTWKTGILVWGKKADNQKLSQPEGLGETFIMDALSQVVDVILIEADGAKKCPIKVPASYEPVLIPQTQMVVACAGLSALGESFSDACFRMKELGAWIRRSEKDIITIDDIGLILMDERGSRKQVSTLKAEYRIVLNQADTNQLREQGRQLVSNLPLFLQPVCVMTAYKGGQHGESI